MRVLLSESELNEGVERLASELERLHFDSVTIRSLALPRQPDGPSVDRVERSVPTLEAERMTRSRRILRSMVATGRPAHGLLASLALVILLAAPPVSADTSPLEPGQRIRVFAPDFLTEPADGEFRAVDGGRLWVHVPDGAYGLTHGIPLEQIESLHRPIMRERNRHQASVVYGGVGLILGGLFGGVLGAAAFGDDELFGAFEGARTGAFLGALTCSGIGVLHGLGLEDEPTGRWEAVPLDELRPDLRAREPIDPSLRIAVSLRF